MRNVIQALANRRDVARVLATWPDRQQSLIRDALALQAIPAPSFDESARAQAVRERFAALGLADVTQDEVGNVYARTPGCAADRRPALLVSAHLDTVFPVETDLTPRIDEQAGRIYAPGLGDNSLGLAAMIHAAQALQEGDVRLPADIWWVATVGEEGLGDLRGMRHVCERLAGYLGVGLVLEGIGLGRVYHAGLGVRRLRVTVRGPGGHSWLHAERPSAIHHLLRMGAALVEEVRLPPQRQAAFNVGLIEGGTSVNTRAAYASFSLDLRAVDAALLEKLETDVRAVIARFESAPGLTVSTELVGNRPSAAIPVDHPLVQAARAVLSYLNYTPSSPEIGSTDANALLAAGIPAVCIGITSGGNAHTIEEYIDIAPLAIGMRQLVLLILLSVKHINEWSQWQIG